MVKWVYDLADQVSRLDDAGDVLSADLDPIGVRRIVFTENGQTVADALGKITLCSLILAPDNGVVIGPRRHLALFVFGWQKFSAGKLKARHVTSELTQARIDRQISFGDEHVQNFRKQQDQKLLQLHKVCELQPAFRNVDARRFHEITLHTSIKIDGLTLQIGGYLTLGGLPIAG
jgi:hypothetical protein